MATTAFLGSQTLLKIGDSASPPVYTTIYEVVDIGDFGAQNDLVEVTHMQSTAKEYIYGLPDGVTFPLQVNYNPTNATHVALSAAQAARTTKHFKLTMPSGGGSLTFSFDGLVIGFQLPFGPNVPVQATFNIKVSGGIIGPS